MRKRPVDSIADLIVGAALAALTFAVAAYFAPRGFQSGFVDMGQDGYMLRQAFDLTQGRIIFRDTFDQYGTLHGYLNAVGLLLFGPRLLALKLFVCGWYAAIALMLWWTARHWLSRPLAAISVLLWLALAPFYQHGIMISPHVYALFLQAAAVLVLLRSDDRNAWRFAAVGVLAALSWAMKQTLGGLFFAAILAYLGLRFVTKRDRFTPTLRLAASLSLGFFGVVSLILTALWSQGALQDWYRQTIAFPRDFYVQNYVDRLGWGTGIAALPGLVAKFIQLQIDEPLYWIVIRGVVIVTAAVQIAKRQTADDLLLMASITACLWGAAFPSANFMHQWWTASLAIPPFVACVQRIASHWPGGDRVQPWVTIAVVLIVTGGGIRDRARATRIRATSLPETIVEPPAFRGIKTQSWTKRGFEQFYRLMVEYRVDHPDARIVSIDASDGFWTGIPESLPFLSFFDRNEHPQPVYWSLPVLSTTTYPTYADKLSQQLREERPLIVDSNFGSYKPVSLPAYSLRAAVESDYGYWYLYAFDDPRQSARRPSIFLATDGSSESGFAERGVVPRLTERLNTSVEGAWRGNLNGPASRYTWPANLPLVPIDRDAAPISAPVLRASIAQPSGPRDRWTVEGHTEDRYAYLLQFRDEPITAGTRLIVSGELQEGAVQIGFLAHGAWAGYVKVDRLGPFEAVLEVQKSDVYRVTIANCAESTLWAMTRRYWKTEPVELLRGRYWPVRGRITQVGWSDSAHRASD